MLIGILTGTKSLTNPLCVHGVKATWGSAQFEGPALAQPGWLNDYTSLYVEI
jgi:hypothetical protein